MTTPTTRELLDGAAKAAGIDIYVEWDDNGPTGRYRIGSGGDAWNPLTDDGDCARLEAALGINVEWHNDCVLVWRGIRAHANLEALIDHNNDKQAARRYASTRAAYEISKGMR